MNKSSESSHGESGAAPKISVVIPTYNREEFVLKAVHSVLAQTFTDYEIIVVDDGSTDDTKNRLESYKGNIRYFYQENGGVSSARNKGVQKARGEWLAFLDSDDEWTKDYLGIHMKGVAEYPEAIGHISNPISMGIDGDDRVLFEWTGAIKEFGRRERIYLRRALHFLIEHLPWFIQSSLLNKEVFLRTGGFKHELTIAEDIDLLARMSLEGPFSFSRKTGVRIYRRAEDIEFLSKQLHREGIRTCKVFAQVFWELKHRRDLEPHEEQALSRALSSYLRALANLSLRVGLKKEARDYYRKAFTVYPSIKSAGKLLISRLPYTVARALDLKGSGIHPGRHYQVDPSWGISHLFAAVSSLVLVLWGMRKKTYREKKAEG